MDAVTLEAFEKDPQKNLYSRRIRRTSGCGSVVVDPTRAVVAPQLEMMRGDLGTEVIKVQNPHGGVDTRGWGPPFVQPET